MIEIPKIILGNAENLLNAIDTFDKVIVLDAPFDEYINFPKIHSFKTLIAFVSEKQKDILIALYGRPNQTLIWTFDNGRPTTDRRPLCCHEYILIYGKLPNSSRGLGGKNPKYIEGAPPRIRTSQSFGRDRLTPPKPYIAEENYTLKSFIHINRTIGYLGCWEKPEELMDILIQYLSTPDDTIIDFFLGSGTTVVSCLKFNRKCIGIELKEEHFDIAKERIQKYMVMLGNLEVNQIITTVEELKALREEELKKKKDEAMDNRRTHLPVR